MRQLFTALFVTGLLMGLSLQVQAELFNRGADDLGNRLIYDSDLHITWYDYSNAKDTWQSQMAWVGTLDVDLGGTHYTDWRLPATVDGPHAFEFDGTTTGGYNITSSEMGHLFYTELGNKGYYDASGNPAGCNSSLPRGLINVSYFQNLQPVSYWSGTEYSTNPDGAWYFYTGAGFQDYAYKNTNIYALAVRTGDVSVAPEPISSLLFVTDGMTLICRKYIRKRKKIEL